MLKNTVEITDRLMIVQCKNKFYPGHTTFVLNEQAASFIRQPVCMKWFT